MKIRSGLFILILIPMLTGCGVNDLAQFTQSSAYQLGYKTAKDLKDTGDSLGQYMDSINSWTDNNNGDNSSPTPLATAEDCANLWQVVGLSSAIAGNSAMKNTPENKAEFIRGCQDGFNS